MVSRIITSQGFLTVDAGILSAGGCHCQGSWTGGQDVCVADGPGEINIPSLVTNANASHTQRGLGERPSSLSSGCYHLTGDLCNLVLTGVRVFRKRGAALLSLLPLPFSNLSGVIETC